MGKNSIRVVVRTRPTPKFAQDNLRIDEADKKILVHTSKDKKGAQKSYVDNTQEDWSYSFDKILHNASQDQVFDENAIEIVNSVLEGYNGTIMAYGQTGAGKTFTMTGATENYKHRGIIPRSLAHVFGEVRRRVDQSVTVRVSYLEIYREGLYDLLSDNPENLHIGYDADGSTVIKGIRKQIANSEEEALNYLFQGEINRTVGAHTLNKNSSRSHCVFTIHLEARSRVESTEKVIVSKLNLVDLAGSERVKKTNSNGVTLEEAKYINQSLTFLEQVVIALADRRSHVPFRQSRLTYVLKDSLGGNCKTLLFANIWPEVGYLEETVSTLRFAQRMMRVSNEATVNVQYDLTALCKKYESDIKALHEELAMHDTLANRSHVNYETYTEEQRFDLNRQVRDYIAGTVADIPVVNLRQIQEVFMQFKVIINNMASDTEERLRGQMVKEGLSFSAGTAARSAGDGGGGGEIDSDGFAVGTAAAGAKPVTSDALKRKPLPGKSKTMEARRAKAEKKKSAAEKKRSDKSAEPVEKKEEKKEVKKKEGKDAKKKKGSEKESKKNSEKETKKDKKKENKKKESKMNRQQSTLDRPTVGSDQDVPEEEEAAPSDSVEKLTDGLGTVRSVTHTPTHKPTREAAFEDYKRMGGSAVADALSENKVILKQKKAELKDLSTKINAAKKEIDHFKPIVEQFRNERLKNGDEHIDETPLVDDEEYQAMKSLHAQKTAYRSCFDLYQTAKGEVAYLEKLIVQCRQRLLSDFDVWFDETYEGLSERLGATPEADLAAAGAEDVLDDGERWDRLNTERIAKEDPGAVAYYQARMNVTRRRSLGKKGDRSGIFR